MNWFDICTFCKFAPPSSCDGKPCCMCPASGREVNTNADRIRAMNDEELAGFISDIAENGNGPWEDMFIEKLCTNCSLEEGWAGVNGELVIVCGSDKCPHGDDIKYWLQQPAEEG